MIVNFKQQAVLVQTVLLLSCAGCVDFKNRSHMTALLKAWALLPGVVCDRKELNCL